MIPKLNKDGYLPQGVHRAGLTAIKRRFGVSSRIRKELFKNMLSLVQLLRKHKGNVKKFLLNGSFVTSKESPEDFDCILIVRPGFDFDSPEARQLRQSKELFNAHILAAMEEDAIECRRLINFFGHDRDGRSKGLLEVIL